MTSKAQPKSSGIQEFAKQVLKLEKDLAARGKQQRKQVEGQLKALRTQANEVGHEVRKKFEGLQGKLAKAVGVASQSQVKEINRELTRLSKKLETLVGKKTAVS